MFFLYWLTIMLIGLAALCLLGLVIMLVMVLASLPWFAVSIFLFLVVTLFVARLTYD